MKRSLLEAARVLGAPLAGEDRPFAAVSTDSRTLPAGALFVALRGPNFDGADFAAAALARGAVGAIVERALTDVRLPYIQVPDSLQALQLLARRWREEFSIPLVAVGGSNGKTTAKEMTAAILSRSGPCLSTHGNLNNHIGVPVTLMRLEPSHRSAVIEMGANRIGDVAELVRSRARPSGSSPTPARSIWKDSAIWTASREARAKWWPAFAPGAAAIINADDAYAGYWRGVASGASHRHFRRASRCGLHGEEQRAGDRARRFATRFTLECPLGARAVTLQAGGAHNIANALAAAAAAAAAGASLEDIAAGLADFRAVAGRLQLKAGLRDSWIIDDSYNANPSSVRAGLEVLRSLPGATWLVLGDMAELGELSRGQPRRTRSLCARLRRQALVRARPAELARRRDLRLGRRVVCRRRFADPPPAGGARAGRDRADQGFAHQSPGAGGAGAHRRRASSGPMMRAS